MVVGICLSSASSRLGKDDPEVASFFFPTPGYCFDLPIVFCGQSEYRLLSSR
jgi:hypothetical protein